VCRSSQRPRWVGGFPREVVRLDGTPWLAVGQYLGGSVLVLDVDSLDTVARIPASRGIAGGAVSTSLIRRGLRWRS
jgi:hypothetical protein